MDGIWTIVNVYNKYLRRVLDCKYNAQNNHIFLIFIYNTEVVVFSTYTMIIIIILLANVFCL